MSRLRQAGEITAVVVFGIPFLLAYLLTGLIARSLPMGGEVHNWVWNIKGGKRQPWRQFWADTKQAYIERRTWTKVRKSSDRLFRQMRKGL
ncbi:hypothetical protein HOU02_gp300 [Caulobacter phage CcrBL9]|uniref:Uncharacterized protein n=1 Tax=Caulobacter phage CcrBL9 TaxID=2283270 RepID=A0A385EEH7_9CAUD|nr:hypothetical protein HOU02_gp300 [Caulobacter phage CcrBL9]AXQ69425.1 hypothetical protein CcrBL9_gp401 [Caulobacter phage CcrBL9]